MMINQPPIILGIETSCDETSIALYSRESNVIPMKTFSQIVIHERFGGVVPDLAARSQLEKIHSVFEELFADISIKPSDIAAIAVTTKPGLPGSLMVGVSFAKGVALVTKKPLIPIDHLEGHAFSPLIEHTVPFPHLCLTASGGHTALYIIHGLGKYELLGYTVDDAAGEAFDKVAKLMGLPYPGGPIIEKLAAAVDYADFFHFPRGKKMINFSFSGLKTAVLYELVRRGAYDMGKKQFLVKENLVLQQKIASSLLCAITDIFIKKIEIAYLQYPHIRAITFAGGVACNKFIKQKLESWATARNILFFAPTPRYCTDNGAMIAFVGSYHYSASTNYNESLKIDFLN